MVIHDTLHNCQPNPVPLMVRALSPRTNGWNSAYVVPAQFPDRHLPPGTRRVRLRSAADFDPAIAITGGVDTIFATARLIDSGCIFTSMLPGKARFQFPAHSHFRQQSPHQYCIKIRHFHRHLLPGAQVVINCSMMALHSSISLLIDSASSHPARSSSQSPGEYASAACEVVTYPRHQQRAVIRQLLNTAAIWLKARVTERTSDAPYSRAAAE